jgi:hypothetical protein
MTEVKRPEPDTPSSEFDLDSVSLDAESILSEKVSDDFFTFTTETKEEGRKLGIEIARSVMQQRLGADYKQEAADSLLQKLKEPDTIDDYRLDGNQLSYTERYDDENNVWEISVFQRYGDSNDIERLNKAVEDLGFTTEKVKSDSQL